jgi:hypothetical protein
VARVAGEVSALSDLPSPVSAVGTLVLRCTMKLRDVLHGIWNVNEGAVVFVKRPWTLDSDAEIGSYDEGYRIPDSMTNRGFMYFLEAHIAREFLEDIAESIPSEDAKFLRLIYYAENDA